MTSESPIHLTLQLNAGKDDDPEVLDRQARQLLAEIRDLDVEDARLVKGGPAPQGAKSAEMVTLGSLAVMVLPTIATTLSSLTSLDATCAACSGFQPSSWTM